MLDRLFNDLRDDGFIYDTDENGHQMSYGEYAAINEAFENLLLNEVKSCYDFEEAAETLKDLVDCSDDVRCFFYVEEYEDFDYDIDEDTGTVDMYNVPDTLKEFFEELKEKYDEEHRVYEYEEEEEWDMEIV